MNSWLNDNLRKIETALDSYLDHQIEQDVKAQNASPLY